MKGTLEKLVNREVSLRTVDGSDNIVTIRVVNHDSVIVEMADGASTLVPFTAVAMLSFA